MGVEGIEYDRQNERLTNLLRSVDRPGDYCVGGTLYAPMPHITVDGAGELSFPVPHAQIEALITAAERAPYGKGIETLVDTSVRDCWQIDADQVHLAGGAWPDSFDRIVRLVAAGLGLPRERLGAELYKLLVYRPGGFFAAHRDTEKIPGMVATLSLSLPTSGVGGELVIRHGDRETIFEMNAREPSELSFAAFYADCLHEARPVTEGHRISLVFNLFMQSGENWTGAPDYADLTERVAACLSEWRGKGATDKLVWLLDHEYSEDGLSFDALKNTDATVARILGEAADGADCVMHAAVLHIEEFGLPQDEPFARRSGWDWEVDESADMEEVFERWDTLDNWVALDGSRPSFGKIALNDRELLPQGALDDAEPDERRLEQSTGNEGPTLELLYHLAALVVWPREKTLDVIASSRIDQAVSWTAMQCTHVDNAEIRRLLTRLTDLWPAAENNYEQQDRAAMLRLLCSTAHGDLAVDFLDRILFDNYNGSESDALAHLIPVIGPEAASAFLPGFVENHMPRRPKGIITFLALAVERLGAASPIWRDVAQVAVRTALSYLRAALEAASEASANLERPWQPGGRLNLLRPGAPPNEWMDHEAVRDLFVLAWRLGLAEESVRAAHAIGDHPKAVTPDRTLPAALADMHEHGDLARTEAYRLLWRRAAYFLLRRSFAPPREPNDWICAAEIPCKCEHCARLRAFCKHPTARIERFKVRKDLRKHLHQTIDYYRLDLDHKTERQGSPYTLVCTKNRASYKRRLDEYAEDVRCIGSLLASAPERETGDTEAERVERLERAQAASERSNANAYRSGG